MKKEVILIYIVCKDLAEAKKIGKALLESKSCGCINIIPQMKSLYFWPPGSGKVKEEDETIMLVKTQKHLFNKIEQTVKRMHSYEVPAIFSLPVDNVSRSYCDWLAKQIGMNQVED